MENNYNLKPETQAPLIFDMFWRGLKTLYGFRQTIDDVDDETLLELRENFIKEIKKLLYG